MSNLWRLIRYDWALHFVLLITNWLPDNVIFLRLRGLLARLFVGSCGKDFRLGRNITIYNSSLFNAGDNVYLAYGCWVLAGEKIHLGNQVMFGPYVVVSAGNHTRLNGSFRYGEQEKLPVSIGSGSWIGAHTTILGGVSIGSGSLVASGATVIRGEYANDSFLAGVPAVLKKRIEDGEY